VLAIVGPTASGKTDLAIGVAKRLGAEIISVDSMQVYRGMDIGTAKPNLVERGGIVHHMIDIADPEDEFSVADFRRHARQIMESSDVPLVISGGSGLHFRALVDPMSFAPTDGSLRAMLEMTEKEDLVNEILVADPGVADHLDLANTRRVVRAVEIFRLTGETPSERAQSAEAEDLRRYKAEIEFTAVGVDPGDQVRARVDQRLGRMKAGGLVAEVKALRPRLGRTAASAVGYREVLRFLGGETNADETFEAISRNTRKLAKKQRTWFQRDPRIRWIPWFNHGDERIERTLEALT
jgi:tRNA dimethylallyltransferase